jgi:hypothetical protein
MFPFEEPAMMKDRFHSPVEVDNGKPQTSLADSMDSAIGEATTVMGAMLQELVRRSLRGGVLQIGQELETFVCEKVDDTLVDRTPVIEKVASDAADRCARIAATEVATEEVRALEGRTRESSQELAARIEATVRTAEETAHALTSRIEATARTAEESTQQTANQLTGRIDQVERKAEETTATTARDLTTQIAETKKQVEEAFQAELSQQVQYLRQRSRKGAVLLQSRFREMEEMAANLAKQITAERAERQAEVQQKAASLQQTLKQEHDQRQSAEADLRKELAQTRDQDKQQLRLEIEQLQQVNQALNERLAELEKPRGIRAMIGNLFSRRKE